jgi:hypothetical protein
LDEEEVDGVLDDEDELEDELGEELPHPAATATASAAKPTVAPRLLANLNRPRGKLRFRGSMATPLVRSPTPVFVPPR